MINAVSRLGSDGYLSDVKDLDISQLTVVPVSIPVDRAPTVELPVPAIRHTPDTVDGTPEYDFKVALQRHSTKLWVTGAAILGKSDTPMHGICVARGSSR